MRNIIPIITLMISIFICSTSYNINTSNFIDNPYRAIKQISMSLNNIVHNNPQMKKPIKDNTLYIESLLRGYTFGIDLKITKFYEILLKKFKIYPIFELIDISNSYLSIKNTIILLLIIIYTSIAWYQFGQYYQSNKNLKNKNKNIEFYNSILSNTLIKIPKELINIIKDYDTKILKLQRQYHNKENNIADNYIKNKTYIKNIICVLAEKIFFIKIILYFTKFAIANPLNIPSLTILLKSFINYHNPSIYSTYSLFIYIISAVCTGASIGGIIVHRQILKEIFKKTYDLNTIAQ